MKKSALTFLSLLVVANLFSFLLVPAVSQAAVDQDIRDQLQPVQDVYGGKEVSDTTFAKTIADIIQIALGFLGVIFLVLIVYAGFLWMTAAGNEEKVKKSKDIMIAAVIGVTIVLAAYAITFFVINNLLKATGVSDSGL